MSSSFFAVIRLRSYFNIQPGIIMGFMMSLCGIAANAQNGTYSFAPPDSEFVMQISREKTDVKIILTFNDSLTFDYVAIERRADNPEFSQCKYISFDELKKRGRHIIEKDMYPYTGSVDVLYRLKLVTKDGAVRTYAPINLPAVKK